ncbi:hypothetical protein SAMN04487948_1261 [Halogranum amylolyticum]|uniref:DUF8160 domain-containing protein n=1 Tax=Halogranum amylolyticum TaxID=660520 RepID=A0A1H8WBG1_9EURY|nr:hypothetical protein [Halogranum amylolyticum]SEP24488.1 hypothetical protein SAMN04487948_1261 [Halogranum amylolyticum]
MANETGDSVKDRFAQRFDDENDEKSENEQNENQEKKEKKERMVKSSKNEKAVNIKSEWTNHSIYLNGDLASSLSHNYKRLDLDLDQDYGLSIKKTRHYYPLIVKLGLERLEELESKEIKERIEELEVK